MKLVWDNQFPYVDRLSTIKSKSDELGDININQNNGRLLKSLRKLKLDLYYPFSTDLDKIKNWSKKWKQVELAKKVIQIVKDGDKKYTIDLDKRVSGDYFIKFFNRSMNTTKFHLCSLGINFYTKPTYSFKTMIMGATKMKRLGFITKEKLNSFLNELEILSYGK